MKPRIFEQHKYFWIFIGMVIFLLFGVVLILQQFNTVQARGVPTATLPPDPIIAELQKQIQNQPNDDGFRHVLETKVSVLIYDATREAVGRAIIPAYQPTLQLPPTETENPNQQRLIGIIDHPSAPFPAAEAIIENAWQEKIDNEYVTVYAGAAGDDPNKGVLIIMTEHPIAFKFIYLPGAGSVKISDFKGSQLVLQAKNKGLFYLDVPGQAMIKSLGEIVPSITPSPLNKIIPTIGLIAPTRSYSYP